MFDPDRVDRERADPDSTQNGDRGRSGASFLASFAQQCMHAEPRSIPVDEILSQFLQGAPGFKSFPIPGHSQKTGKLSALSFVPRSSTDSNQANNTSQVSPSGPVNSDGLDVARYSGVVGALIARVLERSQVLSRESLGHVIAPRVRLVGVQEGLEVKCIRVVTLLELRNQRGVEEFLLGDLNEPARFQAAHGRVLTEVSHYFEHGSRLPREVVRPHMFPQEFRDQVNRYVWHREHAKDGVEPRCLPGEMCFIESLVCRALLLAKVDPELLSRPLQFVRRLVDEPAQQVLACGFSEKEVWGIKLFLDENWVPCAIPIGNREG